MSCLVNFLFILQQSLKLNPEGLELTLYPRMNKRVYFLNYCWSSFPFESNVQQVLKGAQLGILTNEVNYKISFLLSNTNG